ncbi:centromere protein U [Pseudophryne corroboree]|uniref:centromere protein U n=1 Tax=Pseudophryne corroboree TaxID=495146 RepID=UPI0030821B64
MPKKKNKAKNLSPLKKYFKQQDGKETTRKTDANNAAETEGKKQKAPVLKHMGADISAIVQEPGYALHGEEGEESFNPPLHSTAVYEDEPLSPENEPQAREHVSARQRSPMPPPVLQEKSIRQNKAAVKSLSVATPKRSAPMPGAVADKSQRESAKKAKPHRINLNTSRKTDKEEAVPVEVWNLDYDIKSARDLTELDVVLFESKKLIDLYRETVDTGVCTRAVDCFFHSFKEQLIASIKDGHKLQEMKRKNAKIQLEIGRKRKRLIDVKGEIIAKQPRLKQLERECLQQEEMQDAMKNARTFLDNLGHLKQDYIKYKSENPNTKQTYGVSSLPARLVQAESVLKAESHFHNVNTQLQTFIDRQKNVNQ